MLPGRPDRPRPPELPASDEVAPRSACCVQPPTLGKPRLSKRAPRVALWGTTGWELPVRRTLYRVNHGRRPRPGQTGPLGCRALASGRRGEDSAANRPLPARPWAGDKGPQSSLGPALAQRSRTHPPRSGRSAPRSGLHAPRGCAILRCPRKAPRRCPRRFLLCRRWCGVTRPADERPVRPRSHP